MHLRSSLLSLLCATVLCSCGPYYYKPNRVNAPMLSDKGQVQFALAQNNAQVAFSPYKHLGLIGNYAGFSHSDNFGRERAGLFEVGAGYYDMIDTPRHRSSLRVIYDIYGGFGLGRIDIRNNPTYYFPSATVTRMFIQPGIGFRGRVVELGLNWRFMNLMYSNLSAPPQERSPYEGENFFAMEPAVTVRCGYKAVKGEIQYVFAVPFSGVSWGYVNNSLNIGVAVILGGYR